MMCEFDSRYAGGEDPMGGRLARSDFMSGRDGACSNHDPAVRDCADTSGFGMPPARPRPHCPRESFFA